MWADTTWKVIESLSINFTLVTGASIATLATMSTMALVVSLLQWLSLLPQPTRLRKLGSVCIEAGIYYIQYTYILRNVLAYV